MNRRQFLHAGVETAAMAALPSYLRAQNTLNGTASASLTIHPEARGTRVPATFTGLSYESAQLAHPNFFSAQNKNLVALFRRLGPQGILRIGGDSSEYAFWTTESEQPASPDNGAAGPVTGAHALRNTPVTPEAIRNLAAFLDATGWKLIYGLNFGHGTAEKAAEEGAYVVKTVGSRLVALQIGNEPDLFHRQFHGHGVRPADWGYQDYWKEWSDWSQVIRKRIPGVPLAGPDVANDAAIDWVESFARQAKDESVLLTSHYYAEGPPQDPNMNIARLLQPRPELKESIARLMRASSEAQIPYRDTECNSCYNGGKEGVSDTFASALWGADFMFLLAQAGARGVNFHGGGYGHYTPIAGRQDAGFTARPLYYGMLLFSYFADSSIVPVDLDTGGVNMTAYAAQTAHHKLQVAIINKDLKQAVRVTLNSGLTHNRAQILSLSAPSVESQTGVTFGGSEVSGDAVWKPEWRDHLHQDRGALLIDVPATSAALVVLD